MPKDQPLPQNPWTQPWEDIAKDLEVSPEDGLSQSNAEARLEEFGPNRMRGTKTKSAWVILYEQVKSLLVLLLSVAAGLSLAFGDWVEGIAIAAVILINVLIGFFTELRAVRSMEALEDLGSVESKVLRDNRVKQIPAKNVVPGDILILEGGDVVAADIRLLEASKLQADQSALTGESLPVDKTTETLDEETPLADRANLLFKGTAVTRGAGKGVVIATGMDTEIGHISSLVEEAEGQVTPLEKRLDRLGHTLVWITLGIAAVVAVAGVIAGKEWILMIETSIALAVAAVPEGLPIVATIALARGMRRMAQRNALINRLSAVETLGSTNVIFTDKTGTLTENRMTVTKIHLNNDTIQVTGTGLETEGVFTTNNHKLDPEELKPLHSLLKTAVLCNNASLLKDDSSKEKEAVGEPLEIALLVAGAKAGLQREELIRKYPETREVAFDPDVKMMATFHNLDDGNYRIAVKGAPEAVLEKATRTMTEDGIHELDDHSREDWNERNVEMAGDGLRVIALATRISDKVDESPYQDLTLLGLVGLLDPPRDEVTTAIKACQEAGIKVVMVTGDQPNTAQEIGKATGLTDHNQDTKVIHGQKLSTNNHDLADQNVLDAPIFARVSPEQKLDLIEAFQNNGSVVAMTGDGVNDAPALKTADIGIAMGERGTQVAREAADMVLKDDAFSTIVVAIRQGRTIFNNIRKFVLYLLSCNLSEIAVVSLASLVNAPLPIRPLQILFLNLVTDVFPALALGVGEGDEDIMKKPPRDPSEPILTRQHWFTISSFSGLITIAVLSAFGLAFTWLGKQGTEAVTISFLTLAFAQLWHVFNMRAQGSNFLRNEITRNPYIWGALILCAGLLVAAIYVPVMSDVLKVTNPGSAGWAIALTLSLVPWGVGQVWKSIR